MWFVKVKRIQCVIGFLVLAAMSLVAACGNEKEPAAGKRKAKSHLVEVAQVREEVLAYVTERAGTLRAVREVKLFNQEEGRVLRIPVRQGDDVKQGDVLVALDDRLMRAQYDKSLAILRQAEFDITRLQGLKDKQLVAEEAVSRAQTALAIARADERLLKTRLEFMLVRAPFDGKIAERRIEPGDVAAKHTHLLTIFDPSQLITDVQVSELAIPGLKVGDTAQIRIDALGERIFSGQILRIYPKVDASTRLGHIEVALDPVPPHARAGQFSRVSLATGKQKRMVIPFRSLRRDKKGEYVYLLGEGDRVIRQAIVSGLRLADKVEVRQGLKTGQQVVEKGFTGLNEGKKVKPVNNADKTAVAGTGAGDA